MTADPLLEAFFEEANELLADFEAALLGLEEAPGDVELLNRIFRSAHTLKGNSAMLGFGEIARFTHALEDLLDHVRKGQRRLNPAVVDTLLASEDIVRSLVDRAHRGAPASAADAADVERVLAELREHLHGAGTPAPATDTVVAAQRRLYEVRFTPPADVLRRGIDPLTLLRKLTACGEVLRITPDLRALPPLADLDPERSYLAWDVALVSPQPRAEIVRCFAEVSDRAALQITELPLDEPPVAPVGSEPAAAGDAAGALRTVTVHEAASIRVPIDKVDRLINLVGELVITQSMVAQLVSAVPKETVPQLVEAVALMDRHARELHERIMTVRMVPIRMLFARFPRVVRDVGAAVGKQAVLEMSGEDTELDKTVIEAISDPLTHLVRNAVDHGLESPEDRIAAGKVAAGRIALHAHAQGGSIFVEVRDDGRGLDRDRIVARAVQQGLVTADQPLSDEDAFALVFRPGFSTAETVTELSGRGVGMDVVRRNVESLGGSIAIQSVLGRGTTFRLKLPLTLAILDGQLLRVGGERYVVPLASIVESVRPRSGQITRVFDREDMLVIRGEVLPIVRVERLLGRSDTALHPTEGLAVIVEHEGRKAALLVEELLGQQQVVIKSLEANFRRLDGIAGATILGDGRVTLILDVPGLLALRDAQAAEPVMAG
jgi:two-component system chemotaxis sensor kinase CheA